MAQTEEARKPALGLSLLPKNEETKGRAWLGVAVGGIQDVARKNRTESRFKGHAECCAV